MHGWMGIWCGIMALPWGDILKVDDGDSISRSNIYYLYTRPLWLCRISHRNTWKFSVPKQHPSIIVVVAVVAKKVLKEELTECLE